jgi:outer membrane protein
MNFKLLIIIWLSVLTAFLLYDSFSQGEQGFVIIPEVFDQFEMKKELETSLKVAQKTQTNILDSLKKNLQYLYAQIEGEKDKSKKDKLVLEYRVQQQYFDARSSEIEQTNENIVTEYDSKIFRQINQYAKDFGEEEGYKLIFGSNSQGSVMYGDDQTNITKEFVQYINAKYQGKTK